MVDSIGIIKEIQSLEAEIQVLDLATKKSEIARDKACNEAKIIFDRMPCLINPLNLLDGEFRCQVKNWASVFRIFLARRAEVIRSQIAAKECKKSKCLLERISQHRNLINLELIEFEYSRHFNAERVLNICIGDCEKLRASASELETQVLRIERREKAITLELKFANNFKSELSSAENGRERAEIHANCDYELGDSSPGMATRTRLKERRDLGRQKRQLASSLKSLEEDVRRFKSLDFPKALAWTNPITNPMRPARTRLAWGGISLPEQFQAIKELPMIPRLYTKPAVQHEKNNESYRLSQQVASSFQPCCKIANNLGGFSV